MFINFLGTIVFVTIIGIGSLDGRSDLPLFGRYVLPRPAGLLPRPTVRDRRRGEDQAPSS